MCYSIWNIVPGPWFWVGGKTKAMQIDSVCDALYTKNMVHYFLTIKSMHSIVTRGQWWWTLFKHDNLSGTLRLISTLDQQHQIFHHMQQQPFGGLSCCVILMAIITNALLGYSGSSVRIKFFWGDNSEFFFIFWANLMWFDINPKLKAFQIGLTSEQLR